MFREYRLCWLCSGGDIESPEYYALLFCDGDEMALLALREEFVSTLVTDVVDGPDILLQ